MATVIHLFCTPLKPPTDFLGHHGTLPSYSISHPTVPSWFNVLPSLDSFGKSSSTDLELLAAGSLRGFSKATWYSVLSSI